MKQAKQETKLIEEDEYTKRKSKLERKLQAAKTNRQRLRNLRVESVKRAPAWMDVRARGVPVTWSVLTANLGVEKRIPVCRIRDAWPRGSASRAPVGTVALRMRSAQGDRTVIWNLVDVLSP